MCHILPPHHVPSLKQEAESSTVENNVNDTLATHTCATVDSGVEKSAIPNNCQDLFDKSNVVVDDHGHRGRTSTEAECSHFDPSLDNSAVISQTKDSVQK